LSRAAGDPDAPAPPGAALTSKQRADLPAELAERFEGRRFAPVDPPSFLDQEGVELVLIGAAEDASSELGIELDPEAEKIETADLFRQLRLRPGEVPVEPLKSGEWR
jgi:hypothetical protein